jgi:superfamily II DNA or RNA helicase
MAIFVEEQKIHSSGFATIYVGNDECKVEGDAPTDKLRIALSYQNSVVAKFLRTGAWGEVVERELEKMRKAAESLGTERDLGRKVSKQKYAEAKREANTVYLYDTIKKTFPTTLLKRVVRLFHKVGIRYELVDQQKAPKPTLKVQFDELDHEPRDYQTRAVDIAMHCRCGAFALATNAGKTGIMLRIVAKKKLRTLILVQKQELLFQIHDAIRDHLHYDAGLVGANKFKLKPITVAIVNSAHTRIQELVKYGFDQVFVDEGHHAASRIHYTVLTKVKPYCIYSMTGTDFRTRHDENIILEAAFGGTVQRIDNKFMVAHGYSAKLHAEILDMKQPLHPSFSWRRVYERAILLSLERAEKLVAAIKKHADGGKTVLVLTEETGHGQTICNLLTSAGLDARFMHGSVGREERTAARLDFKDRKFQVLVGTTIYDEGVDFPTLDVVAFAGGKKAKGKVFQRLGRGQRRGLHADGSRKDIATVIDFFDHGHRLLKRHSLRRLLHMHEVGVVLPKKYTELLTKEGLINGRLEHGEHALVRGRSGEEQGERRGQEGHLLQGRGRDVPGKGHQGVRRRGRRGEEGEGKPARADKRARRGR